MAMDFLPIQATSVPYERVFLSAKETDTTKRNQISPVLMEALQLLKFALKKERLNFMNRWPASESDLRKVKPTYDLESLFVGNCDSALDAILNDLSKYDE
jgi:hypothetical protein